MCSASTSRRTIRATPEPRPTRWSARRSPRCSGPWAGTEFYVNAGIGFHSNDARGATISVDPATGEPAERVTPLAAPAAPEVGVRTVKVPGLQTTVTVWTLGLDSELLFVGDAGATEASRPSRRYGIEWANYYSPWPWLGRMRAPTPGTSPAPAPSPNSPPAP